LKRTGPIVKVARAIAIGARLGLEMKLPNDPETMHLTGEVVWQQETPANKLFPKEQIQELRNLV